jgi:hypothetical protein
MLSAKSTDDNIVRIYITDKVIIIGDTYITSVEVTSAVSSASLKSISLSASFLADNIICLAVAISG